MCHIQAQWCLHFSFFLISPQRSKLWSPCWKWHSTKARNAGCFASYPVVCVSLHEQGTVDTQSGLAAQSDPIAVYLRLCQYINRCVPVKPVLIIFWHYPNHKNAGGLHDWGCPIRVTWSQNYGEEQVNCTGAFRWKCILEKNQMQNPAWHRMQSVGLQTWWFSQKMFCTVANVLKNKERICMLCIAVLPNHKAEVMTRCNKTPSDVIWSDTSTVNNFEM